MTPEQTSGVALELERLRGDLGRDLGEIKGLCAVLVERSDRTERDVRDLDRALAEEREVRAAEVRAVRADLDAIRSRQWPLPSIAALVAVAGLVITLWQMAS